jgi:hypothetical protein
MWLVIASAALFIKEQVRKARLWRRRLDVLDARIEAHEHTPRPRTEPEEFVAAREAGPRRPRQARR